MGYNLDMELNAVSPQTEKKIHGASPPPQAGERREKYTFSISQSKGEKYET